MKKILCLIALFFLSSHPIDASDEGRKIFTSLDDYVFDWHAFECDRRHQWEDWDQITALEENENACKRCRNRHTQVAIRNRRLRSIWVVYSREKISFEERETLLSRIAPKFFKTKFVMTTEISARQGKVEPNYQAVLRVLKNGTITYQEQADCPEDCEQTGEHDHWGEKNELPFDEGETIVLGESPFVKSAAKE